jgi:hypothetical protein
MRQAIKDLQALEIRVRFEPKAFEAYDGLSLCILF